MSTSTRTPKQQRRFELFSRKRLIGRTQHYFRIVAANGEKIAQSESYTNKDDRNNAVQIILGLDAGTPVIDKGFAA